MTREKSLQTEPNWQGAVEKLFFEKDFSTAPPRPDYFN